REETLTQDVILPKRSFGGLTNISYLFSNYTIGTGATLTFMPGVVCKFNGGGMTVNKGMIADGGFSADSNIVFTDYRDDFYGGDANADSSASIPAMASWNGITFNDQSLDPLCHLKHCFVKYAYYGIYTTSASPNITYSSITNSYYGVYATAASNPVFNYCDFNDNYYWSVNNVDKSFVIDATNCWWGSNLGPIQTNSSGNGTSVQELITTAVNYQPFKTTGSGNPLMGDVSLNGIVQAYDASLVLQKVVSLISLNPTQIQVADVSAASGVTAYDASLILQYVIGLVQFFPAELTKAPLAISNTDLTIGSAVTANNQDINIPLKVTNVSGLYSAEIKIKYDPGYLKLTQFTNLIPDMNHLYYNDSINGVLTIAMAGTNPLVSDTSLAQLTFHTYLLSANTVTTYLTVDKFLSNETDRTAAAINGSVTIMDNATNIPQNNTNTQGGIFSIYPNPSNSNSILSYQLDKDNQSVNIEVFNMLGQKVLTVVNENQAAGKYSVSLSKQGNSLDYGSYLIRFTVGGLSQSQIFQVVR
ncbi:MAG: cohesin domain-containing protein, partial [Bacteroidales bacterium]